MPAVQLPPTSDALLKRWRSAFARVGWFVPAFVSSHLIDRFAEAIERTGDDFAQQHLELFLASIHTPQRLAAMALHRYPETPIIKDFAVTILEAVQAHLIGLHHVAIAGVVPVIEGIGTRFAKERGLTYRGSKGLFKALMDDCTREAHERQTGVPAEIEVMMDSFSSFTTAHLYVDSTQYPLSDKTNRHGIVHGHYTDADYGSPLNFFKAMSAIDVLTFVSIFRHPGSVFVPSQTRECAAFLERVQAQANLQ